MIFWLEANIKTEIVNNLQQGWIGLWWILGRNIMFEFVLKTQLFNIFWRNNNHLILKKRSLIISFELVNKITKIDKKYRK